MGRECNTLTRTPGKSSNILLGWPLELGEIDGSHSMKKIPKLPWKMAEGKTVDSEKQTCRMDILGKAREFLEYAAYRAWAFTLGKREDSNILDTIWIQGLS